ncbi:MAG: hypothetical protein JJU28_05005 [Cyclobacteriaceae bacterium]|nr:hypothetical protein [Cyclobacteriaceae bacterium]
MNSIIAGLRTNWHVLRWLRLGIGLYAMVMSVMHKDTLLGFVAAFFLFQAVTNTGCCGASACSTGSINSSKAKNDTEEIEFEEIDTKK